jgi:hypothetical protein
MRPDIPLGPLERTVERIPGALLRPRGARLLPGQGRAVARPPGHDVRVHVRDALPGVGAVLHRDAERRRARVRALERAADARDGGEEVAGLGRGEVAQPRYGAQRRDEDVPREERLEVDEGEAVRRLVEDLARD